MICSTSRFEGVRIETPHTHGVASRTIKALETELGVLLFARSTHTLKLTAEGARFYRDCVHVLKTFEEATQQFNALRAKPHGQLKVGWFQL
jgi:DNA-binding transcriptional LysR family regulator